MDETQVVDSGAPLTRWIKKMTGPTASRRHVMSVTNGHAWCACGKYCGGQQLSHDQMQDSLGYRSYTNMRHQLHLTEIHNAERKP